MVVVGGGREAGCYEEGSAPALRLFSFDTPPANARLW